MESMFIAAPFTLYFGGQKDIKDLEKHAYQSIIETIAQFVKEMGYEVNYCHKREEWGDAILPPDQCAPLDFDHINNADILIAIPGNPFSGGVHIELGWASSLQKKIIIALERGIEYSPLIYGLGTITLTEILFYDNIDEIPEKMKKFLPVFIKKHTKKRGVKCASKNII